ncbi:hypothetical protein V2G26_007994 [Clonostachys chloroleuca]
MRAQAIGPPQRQSSQAQPFCPLSFSGYEFELCDRISSYATVPPFQYQHGRMNSHSIYSSHFATQARPASGSDPPVLPSLTSSEHSRNSSFLSPKLATLFDTKDYTLSALARSGTELSEATESDHPAYPYIISPVPTW